MLRFSKYLRELKNQPGLVLWALWLITIPFYIMPSGLPQPGFLFIGLLVPIALRLRNRLSPVGQYSFRRLLWFTLWVCTVNLVWAVVLWSWGTDLLFSFYYINNTMVFLIALALYRRYGDNFLRVTLHMVFAVVLLQVLLSFTFRSGAVRNTLFFQNPNQLGYYALLAACLIAAAQRRMNFNLILATIGLIACGYLAVLSASRSAAAGIAILGILLLAASPRMIILGSIAVIALTTVGPVADRFELLQHRVANDRVADKNFFEERHYDRIVEYKEYLVFGAGEGNIGRFNERGRGEIHSSLGTILFSYGIVGLMLCLTFLWSIVRKGTIRISLMLLPPLSYTMAHQGFRFTMLWVLLALLVCLKDVRERR